jgi:hypothetical protein
MIYWIYVILHIKHIDVYIYVYKNLFTMIYDNILEYILLVKGHRLRAIYYGIRYLYP